MGIAQFCEVGNPLGHSWPGIHWWMSLTASDQGAWVSGIGAFVAAGLALLIAMRDGWQRKKDRQARGWIIASYLYADVSLTSIAFQRAEVALGNALSATTPQMMVNGLLNAYNVLLQTNTTKIATVLDKLVDLPRRHGISLAALPDVVHVLCTTLADQVNKGPGAPTQAILETASGAMQQVRLTQSRLQAFERDFEPHFAK